MSACRKPQQSCRSGTDDTRRVHNWAVLGLLQRNVIQIRHHTGPEQANRAGSSLLLAGVENLDGPMLLQESATNSWCMMHDDVVCRVNDEHWMMCTLTQASAATPVSQTE